MQLQLYKEETNETLEIRKDVGYLKHKNIPCWTSLNKFENLDLKMGDVLLNIISKID